MRSITLVMHWPKPYVDGCIQPITWFHLPSSQSEHFVPVIRQLHRRPWHCRFWVYKKKEYLTVYRFEQFCISDCNEKLQQFFIWRFLKTTKRKVWDIVKKMVYVDHQGCIELIETKNGGSATREVWCQKSIFDFKRPWLTSKDHGWCQNRRVDSKKHQKSGGWCQKFVRASNP